MKAVILAGRLGTLISEDTNTRPKPMIVIDGIVQRGHQQLNEKIITYVTN